MTTNPIHKLSMLISLLIVCVLMAALDLVAATGASRFRALELTVNGESMVIKNRETLSLVRGDVIVLEKADIWPNSGGGSLINFLGYRNSWKDDKSEDDSYQIIDTSLLKNGWSVNGQTEKYSILIKKDHKIVGKIITNLKKPKLSTVELYVNDKPLVVLDGSSLVLNSMDNLKVGSVKSTEVSINRRLSVKLDELAHEENSKKFELKVFHGTYHLGSIFILLAGRQN